MIIIAAVAENGVIGAGDHMPWDIPEEYEYFLETIRGETVIMGRKSHEIFGNDLTSRHTIVVSRSEAPAGGALVVHSLDRAYRVAESLGFEVYCAGGGSIYRAALDLSNRMLLSEIQGEFPGDVTFPRFSREDWQEILCEQHRGYVLHDLHRIAG